MCGGEGAGRAPSPAPEDQSAQVRAVSWLILMVKKAARLLPQEETLKKGRTSGEREDWAEKLVEICVKYVCSK